MNLPPSSVSPPTSYDPYASLHPGFHNYPPSSFQPPTDHPNPLHPNPPPPSTSTFSFNPASSQPPRSVFQMTPYVPFVAVSDPIKVFDGLVHTHPTEKFLDHLSARQTFQLGPQPLDIQSYLIWH